jgi:hypothetical protein
VWGERTAAKGSFILGAKARVNCRRLVEPALAAGRLLIVRGGEEGAMEPVGNSLLVLFFFLVAVARRGHGSGQPPAARRL